MSQIPPFDKDDYKAFNSSRSAFLNRLLPGWKKEFAMETAFDLGCGFGFSLPIWRSKGSESQPSTVARRM